MLDVYGASAIEVRFKKLRPGAIIPEYQTEGAAGFDFAALIDQNTPHAESFISLDLVTKSPRAEMVYHVVIPPGEQRIIPTGLAVAVPRGYELQARPRSGLAAKKCITITNSPGTIDSDYRGEIFMILFNLGKEPLSITSGDRIGQGVIAPVPAVRIVEVADLDETARGEGGLGSTGVK